MVKYRCKDKSAPPPCHYSHILAQHITTEVKMSGVIAICVFILLLSMAAARGETPTLNFLVLGDWGGQSFWPYTTPAERELAKAMGSKASDLESQFTLALGDNFYETGVKNVHDKRFDRTFENVFTASSLQRPWYVVCGNHDHYGNCSAEIAYSKVSSRWNFPDFYYAKEFDIPGINASVAILFIDTVLLAGVTHPTIRSLPPDGPDSYKVADDHWSFINKTLAGWAGEGAKERWRIVVGHYPVWSVAEHGPTKELVEKLKPMLEKYGVTAYFCGHDHNMQHLSDSGVQYYVTGAGHLIDPSKKHENDVPKGSLKYYYGPDKDTRSTGAFAAVSATPSSLTVTYYDYNGGKLYEYTSTK